MREGNANTPAPGWVGLQPLGLQWQSQAVGGAQPPDGRELQAPANRLFRQRSLLVLCRVLGAAEAGVAVDSKPGNSKIPVSKDRSEKWGWGA